VQDDGVMAAQLVNGGEATLKDFRLCFSLVAPGTAVSGCRMVQQVGGYMELSPELLASLVPGGCWDFAFAYDLERHHPINGTWGPTGAYLILENEELLEVQTEPMAFPESARVTVLPPEVQEPELRLIPHPAVWQASGGVCDASSGFAWNTGAADELATALDSAEKLAARCGFPEFSKEAGVSLVVQIPEEPLVSEEYALTLTPSQITLSASDYPGVFYAAVTLQQLRLSYDGFIPCGTLRDRPRFQWRGQHLDCARHFYRVESLLRLLDLMALLKLNRFHWHLIDDEAFRLELDSFPELTERTAQRGHGCLTPGVFGSGKEPSGGTYSKADVAQVVGHAAKLGIEVMPEIEIPAHARALLQVFPEMRDPADESREVSVQGYCENTLNPAMPQTWAFLEKALPEVHSRFPLGVVHLGCDEFPPGTWAKSPAVERLKAEHGLHSTDDVQEWMMSRAASIVAESGGRPAAWEEAIRGQHDGIGHDALLFSWTGSGPGLEAARAGYDVVMCPANHIYFDMAPNSDPSQRGFNWAGFVSMKDALCWDPVPEDEPELETRILGIQGQLWSETVLEDRDCEAMLAPRILALSEGAWSSVGRKRELPEFVGATTHFRKLLERWGWNCHELI